MPATVASRLVAIVTAADPAERDRSIDAVCRDAGIDTLQAEATALEAFRHGSPNLYERVRALFFLHAIHRFHLPARLAERAGGGPGDAALIPHEGFQHLLNRRFEEAIETFLAAQERQGPSDALSSALAAAYRDLGLQTLAN